METAREREIERDWLKKEKIKDIKKAHFSDAHTTPLTRSNNKRRKGLCAASRMKDGKMRSVARQPESRRERRAFSLNQGNE